VNKDIHASFLTADHRKLLKFYFQSFLLGVPEIMVGFRDFKGRLQTLQPFKTLEIPRMVRGKPNAWDPNICLAWGERFLGQVRDWMLQIAQDPTKESVPVGRVSFTPGKGVSFKALGDAEVAEVRAGEDRIGFLPLWYMS
jgi:RAT1-interacting protein